MGSVGKPYGNLNPTNEHHKPLEISLLCLACCVVEALLRGCSVGKFYSFRNVFGAGEGAENGLFRITTILYCLLLERYESMITDPPWLGMSIA